MSNNLNNHNVNKEGNQSIIDPSSCMEIGVEPSMLSFEYPSKEHSKANLIIHNRNPFYVAFKLKTTTPRQYCVRPTSGFMTPDSTCYISISLAVPPETLSALSNKWKDKFLVVCKRIDGVSPPMKEKEINELVQKYWSRIETDGGPNKGDQFLFEKRIRSEIVLKIDKLENISKRNSNRALLDNPNRSTNTQPNSKNIDSKQNQTELMNSKSRVYSRTKHLNDNTNEDNSITDFNRNDTNSQNLLKSQSNTTSNPSITQVDPEVNHSKSSNKSSLTSRHKKPRDFNSQNDSILNQNTFQSKNLPNPSTGSLSLSDLLYPPAVYWIIGLCVLFFFIGSAISK